MAAFDPGDATGSAGSDDVAPPVGPMRDSAERIAALERECDALRDLVELQERDRQLVAYEIHDGLAQYIAGALMLLQASDRDGGVAPTPEHLAETTRLLRAAGDEARRLVGGLRPPVLDERGLEGAIATLVAEARGDVASVEFMPALTAEPLAPPLQTAILRIVQEALWNARRHAHATHVRVALQRLPGSVRLVVSDDGVGFDPRSIPENRYGIEGIRRRARLVGAEPRIESAPGRGTSLEIDFPLRTS